MNLVSELIIAKNSLISATASDGSKGDIQLKVSSKALRSATITIKTE